MEKTYNPALKIFPWALVFYEISTYLSNDLYLPALPEMVRHLNTTEHLGQLTLSFWFLGSACTQFILGPLADRYGRRGIFLFTGVLFIVATMVCALTTNIMLFLGARFFQGCAASAVVLMGYAFIHECYDSIDAVRIIAMLSGVTILSPAFGPLLGSLVIQWASWRVLFWILFFWSCIGLVLLVRWLPENPPSESTSFSLTHLVKQYYGVISNQIFLLNTLIYCCIFAGIIAWIAIGPFLVVEALHFEPWMFGLFQLCVFGSFIVISRFVKYAVAKLSMQQLISRGLTIILLSSGMGFIATYYFAAYFYFFIICLMFYTGGAALCLGSLQRLAIEASSMPMGMRMTVFSSLTSWSSVVGSSVVGFFYTGTALTLSYCLCFFALIAFIIKIKLTYKNAN